MNQWTTYIYLFFLKECNGINHSFYEKTFQFHRFLTLEKKMKWERLFWSELTGDIAKDVELENVLRTLIHHELIDSGHKVNEAGLLHLNETKEQNNQMTSLLNDFLENYNKGRFEREDCFLEGYSFPVACHLCQERVCINNAMTMKDFGRLFNFKGVKNPHKKRAYDLPHF